MNEFLASYGITFEQAILLALIGLLALYVFRNAIVFCGGLILFAAFIWVVAKFFLIIAIIAFVMCLATFMLVMSSPRRRGGG